MKPTFVEVAQLLIKDAETRVALGENAPTLLRDYRQRLKAYCEPFFARTKVDAVDARRLREFRQWLAARELKPSTILCVMSFVSKVLKLAEDDGLLRHRPVVPRRGHRDSPRPWFDRKNYRHLLAFLRSVEHGNPRIEIKGRAVDWELRAMVTFMVNSFLRPGDLFVLRNKHVELVTDEGGREFLRLSLPPSKDHTYPVITMPVATLIFRRVLRRHQACGFGRPDDHLFLPWCSNRAYAKELVRRQFTEVLSRLGLKQAMSGDNHTLYSLRHTAIMFRLLNARDLDLLTLARACRTSVEMIDRFYAKPLTAEMNRDRLHSFRRPTRYLG